MITLRNFYSLNNSFYQKDIFKENLLPSAYNNIIKYAFDYALYEKQFISDINENIHEYIIIKTITVIEHGKENTDDNNEDNTTETTITATNAYFQILKMLMNCTHATFLYQHYFSLDILLLP